MNDLRQQILEIIGDCTCSKEYNSMMGRRDPLCHYHVYADPINDLFDSLPSSEGGEEWYALKSKEQ